MTRLLTLLSFFAIIHVFSGCGSDDPGVKAPENLALTIDISEDGSGTVTVSAKAEGAKYYKIAFGDVVAEIPFKSTNGFTSHTYEESGDYTITVTAHTDENLFITETETITVAVFIPIPATGYTTPTEYVGMDSHWADEFNGVALNEDDWTFEIGGGGWGNNELEYYTNENTTLTDGYLIIEARKEDVGGRNYTSSRIITRSNVTMKYGRVDVRAALPKGKGIWPAIWMLGSNIGTVGWPKCGEIDIMEMIGGLEARCHGTAHWDNNGSYASYGGWHDLSTGILADKFHVYSIIWDETKIVWYIDDIQYHIIDITPDGLSEFHEEYFFIMNIAVGGNWPGAPDATLVFPQRMIVDYIRVFKDE